MGKRITNITIDNFKGYYSKKEINLPNGENLLIYGENGSGKSSLFTALKDYFSSGLNKDISFKKNYHRDTDDGEVNVSFSNFTEDGDLIEGTESTFKYPSNKDNITTYGVQFIKDTAQTLGFLDYKDILKLYNLQQDTPNLFEYIILGLLGNQSIAGYTRNIQSAFQKIVNDTITNAHTRRSPCHKSGLINLSNFNTDIRNYLDNIFNEVNNLLNNYFPHFSLTVNYNLSPMQFNYGIRHRKSDWSIVKQLVLNIKTYGKKVDGYVSSLNEARLSAISICLYLASLKQTAAARENKTLFLDDIFIGLDSGNRMPILKILQQEFNDYQIFISTYDRGWFNLINNVLCSHSISSWKSVELYEGYIKKDESNIFDAILVGSKNDLDSAKHYLFSQHKPDYPASANYLRKAFERMLYEAFPNSFFKNEKMDNIEQYRLTKILDMVKDYIDSLESNIGTMDVLSHELANVKAHLYCLLHPLSHSVPDLPIYKGELLSVYNSYYLIEQQLKIQKVEERCVCLLEANSPLRIRIRKMDGTWLYYFFKPLKNYFVYKGMPVVLPDMKCRISKMTSSPAKPEIGNYHPKKNDPKFAYNSIQEMIESIKTFLPNTDYGKDAIIAVDTDFVIEILNTDNTWSLFSDYIKNKLKN